MAGPNPATTEWVPVWSPVISGPTGPTVNGFTGTTRATRNTRRTRNRWWN